MIETDVFILGKGPAGIQAAIYLKRANINPIVVGKDLGMSLKAKTVENFYGFDLIGGSELVEKGIVQANSLGINVITDEVVSIAMDEEAYIVKTLNETYKAKSFLFASGTHRVQARIRNLMKFEGKGISYCAVCDAFFFRNKIVGVLGHSDYASNEVDELVDIADKVYVFTNGEEPEAEFDERATIIKEKIISVDGDTKLEKVIFEENEIELDGLFVALGTASSTDLAQKLGVVIDKNRILVDENMETNLPGIYAAGDCTPGFQQIAKAVGDGCVAGMNMATYIRQLRRKKK